MTWTDEHEAEARTLAAIACPNYRCLCGQGQPENDPHCDVWPAIVKAIRAFAEPLLATTHPAAPPSPAPGVAFRAGDRVEHPNHCVNGTVVPQPSELVCVEWDEIDQGGDRFQGEYDVEWFHENDLQRATDDAPPAKLPGGADR